MPLNNKIFADLHIHTYYSDGTHSPKEIFEFAKNRNLKYIAITDHDTVYHLDSCEKLSKEYGINLIRGVELSCYNFEKMKKVHIIGLNISKSPNEIKRLGESVLEGRNKVHRQLIETLVNDGYEISFEDALKHSKTDTVFKMHLFLAIKEKYPDIDEGFYNRYFLKEDTKKADLEMNYIDIKEGIQAIIDDGGVPILAHPNLYHSFPEVGEYVSYGLQGIEKSHFVMSEEDINKSIELADKYNLYLSGGSDFHSIDDSYDNDIGDYGLTEKEFQKIKAILLK